MDLFTALQTSVSGLKAQAFAMDNISGNIANSQTTGYKRIDTSFVDLLAEMNPRHQVAGSVAAYSQLTNTLQGNIASTGVGTNMALNGDGFFVVQKRTTDASGGAVFSGTNLFTRRGDFAPDKDGYLVNGAGSFLSGSMLDPVTGQATASGPIRIPNTMLPAKRTTTIDYSANLPSTPATANTTTTPGSELLDPSLVSGGSGVATVPVGDAQTFINSSIAGPALTVYSASGAPLGLQTRWAKVENGDASATPATQDVWNLYYADETGVSGNATSWSNVGPDFNFNASGQLTSPAGGSITIPGVTIDGANIGNVSMNFGVGGLTQYSAVTGGVTTNSLQQNGYASGTLNAVDVTEDGKVTGTYSNGTTLALANIDVVRFNNPNGLKADSLGNYTQTLESGVPITGLNDTSIIGGHIEQSNSDIAGEFSKMIVTQQAYSANTRVMSTAQTMISDLLNVIR